MRKRINAAVASRERARERNKLKQCHDSLLNIEQSRYEMDNLRTKEEDGITAIITDKKRIHNMITAHFKDWFAIPNMLKSFMSSQVESTKNSTAMRTSRISLER